MHRVVKPLLCPKPVRCPVMHHHRHQNAPLCTKCFVGARSYGTSSYRYMRRSKKSDVMLHNHAPSNV